MACLEQTHVTSFNRNKRNGGGERGNQFVGTRFHLPTWRDLLIFALRNDLHGFRLRQIFRPVEPFRDPGADFYLPAPYRLFRNQSEIKYTEVDNLCKA